MSFYSNKLPSNLFDPFQSFVVIMPSKFKFSPISKISIGNSPPNIICLKNLRLSDLFKLSLISPILNSFK